MKMPGNVAGSLIAQRCMRIPETEVAAAALCRLTATIHSISRTSNSLVQRPSAVWRMPIERTSCVISVRDLEIKTGHRCPISDFIVRPKSAIQSIGETVAADFIQFFLNFT